MLHLRCSDKIYSVSLILKNLNLFGVPVFKTMFFQLSGLGESVLVSVFMAKLSFHVLDHSIKGN